MRLIKRIRLAYDKNQCFYPFSLTNKNTGEKFKLSFRGGTVGRFGDVKIQDKYVSSNRLVFSFDSIYNLIIKDVGSTNGTFVNGERLNTNQEYILKSYDVLTLGQTSLLVKKDFANGYMSN